MIWHIFGALVVRLGWHQQVEHSAKSGEHDFQCAVLYCRQKKERNKWEIRLEKWLLYHAHLFIRVLHFFLLPFDTTRDHTREESTIATKTYLTNVLRTKMGMFGIVTIEFS